MRAEDFRKYKFHGSALERGRAHGEALRELIAEHYARWFDNIAKDLGVDPQSYLRTFLNETDFMPAIEKWTPDLLEEVRGIAEGANQPFEIVLARQYSDEEPWYRRNVQLENPSHAGCTSVGYWTDTDCVVAQNMDLPHWCDGLQILLHLTDPETGLQVFQYTMAGKINLAGMNSAGLGVCCNTLSQLNYSKTGLPEDFVVRGFLQQTRLEDGERFLREIEHASGQNYTIGQAGHRAINLECSANAVIEFVPETPPQSVYHSNHPLTNDDQSLFLERSRALDAAGKKRLFHGTSLERFEALEGYLSQQTAGLTIDNVKTILSSHDGPICRHGDTDTKNDNFTLGCLILESGEVPKLHIAPGPPCETQFLTFEFD